MYVYRKEYCSLIINAACCLHNMCIDNCDDFEVYDTYLSEREENINTEVNTISGSAKRDQLYHQLPLFSH